MKRLGLEWQGGFAGILDRIARDYHWERGGRDAAARTRLVGEAPPPSRLFPREPWKDMFLTSLSVMPNFRAACRYAGVTTEHARRASVVGDFKVARREAVNAGVDFLERIAHVNATYRPTKKTRRRALWMALQSERQRRQAAE